MNCLTVNNQPHRGISLMKRVESWYNKLNSVLLMLHEVMAHMDVLQPLVEVFYHSTQQRSSGRVDLLNVAYS